MGQFAAIATVLGSLMSANAAEQEGAAAESAGEFNAQASIGDANNAAERTRIMGRRLRSLNITRVAKSGVELRGSPLEALAQNAFDVERQALREQQAGQIAASLYRATGQNAREAGQTAATAQIFGGVGQGLYQFGGGVARQGVYGTNSFGRIGFRPGAPNA